MRVQKHLYSGPTLVCICALISGVALRLSYPPSDVAPLIFAVFVPTLWALNSQKGPAWFYSGFLIGLVAYVDAPIAFIMWGAQLVFLPWIVVALMFATLFALSFWLRKLLHTSLRWTVLPLVWPAIVYLAEKAFELPISLAFSLVFDYSEILAFVPFLGSVAADSIIIACSTVLTAVFHDEIKAKAAITAFMGFSMLAALAYLTLPFLVRFEGESHIHLVQPATTLTEQRLSRTSLGDRLRRERTLDALTESALERDPGLILWPEGGNGLFNFGVPSRRAKIEEIASGKDSTLLLAGMELTADGELYNVVHQVESGEFVDFAAKVNTVRFSEVGVSEGKPRALATSYGRFGISICFDSLFISHARKLAEQGAQAILITSNDSSFGDTAMPLWHAGYSILNGAEVLRPVAFLSNRGASLVTNFRGKIIASELAGKVPMIFSSKIMLVSGSLPYWVPFLRLSIYLAGVAMLFYTSFRLDANS